MSSYTVKSGDNLWNIIKRQLKLTNNTEIANKVNDVAKANGIKNANQIFAGQKIEIGDATDKLEKSTSTETAAPVDDKTKTTAVTNPITTSTDNKKQYSAEVNQAVDNKLKSWDIKNYDDFMTSMSTKVSIFSSATKTPEDKEKAYTDYSEKLLLEHYDVNQDGTVTEKEFAQVEEEGTLKTNEIARKHDKDSGIYDATHADVENDNRIANRTANLFAKNLDMNGDGAISKEEFSFFNKTADQIDGKEDGVINAGSEGAMFQSVTGMNADNKEINSVVNKYLLGQTLTPEEQKILDGSSVKIRAAMAKAAGLDKTE